MTSKWRLVARAAIQKAIASVDDGDLAKLKKAIDGSYPFEERAYHPYKIWLNERREAFLQLGIYKAGKAKMPRFKRKGRKAIPVSPGQLSLFDASKYYSL